MAILQQDLHKLVLENPCDDGLRGIYADWISEGGELPQLELPRVEVVLRDGIPDEIHCPMNRWVGHYCGNCIGSGNVYLPNENGDPFTGYAKVTCVHCHGNGRVQAIAKLVCEKWPVTKVLFPDRSPDIDEKSNWGWYIEPPDSLCSFVAKQLWTYLPSVKWVNSRQRALDFLSIAAVNYGRNLAGLPLIGITMSS